MEKPAWRIEKEKMVEEFHNLNQAAVKGQVVFAGSSLMEQFPIHEWSKQIAGAPAVYNRGVGGYTTTDMLPILDACVLQLAPKKLFINIGTNDLSNPAITIDEMISRYDEILCRIEQTLPQIVIYLMAYYPVNYEVADAIMRENLKVRSNEKIALANQQVRLLAEKHHQRYIDVNAPLKDAQGNLRAEYTIEGMHIKPEGYRTIFPAVMQFILE